MKTVLLPITLVSSASSYAADCSMHLSGNLNQKNSKIAETLLNRKGYTESTSGSNQIHMDGIIGDTGLGVILKSVSIELKSEKGQYAIGDAFVEGKTFLEVNLKRSWKSLIKDAVDQLPNCP